MGITQLEAVPDPSLEIMGGGGGAVIQTLT